MRGADVPGKGWHGLEIVVVNSLTPCDSSWGIVSVRFQPIGSAPILKQKVFKISASSRFSVVLNFLRKKVGTKDGDGLFLYVNNVFAPGLDEGVGNLYRVSDDSSGSAGRKRW